MSLWDYDADHVTIDISSANDMKMAFALGSDPTRLTVDITNYARRWVYCSFDILDPVTGVHIGPVQQPPPVGFDDFLFRAFNLLSAADDITFFLRGSFAPSQATIELPYPDSMFSLRFAAPSVKPNTTVPNDMRDGFIAANVATLVDCWLGEIISFVVARYQMTEKIPMSKSMALFNDFYTYLYPWFSTFYTANNSFHQGVSAIASASLSDFIDSIYHSGLMRKVYRALFPHWNFADIQAAVQASPWGRLWSLMRAAMNIEANAIDLFKDPCGEVLVDCLNRRAVALRPANNSVTVAAGARAQADVIVELPDRTRINLSNDRFLAQVQSTQSAGQGWTMDPILVTDDLGDYMEVPVSVEMTVRAGTVEIIELDPGADGASNTSPQLLTSGLGAQVVGIAEGQATFFISALLKDGAFPTIAPNNREATQFTDVTVLPPLVAFDWRVPANPLAARTGLRYAAPFDVTVPAYATFQSDAAFAARAEISPDGSQLHLWEIADDNGIAFPFELVLTLANESPSTLPLARFTLPPSILTGSMAGPMAFADGLGNFIEPLHDGSASVDVQIVLAPQVENLTLPALAPLYLDIDLGRVEVMVNPSRDFLFDDDLTTTYGVHVNLPDGTVFITDDMIDAVCHFSKANSNGNYARMTLQSIVVSGSGSDVIYSPVAVRFDLSTDAAVFDGTGFVSTQSGVATGSVHAPLRDFLRAQHAGTSTLTISLVADIDAPELQLPAPFSVTLTVARPVEIQLEGFKKIYPDGTMDQSVTPLGSAPIDLWSANALLFVGTIGNPSDGMTLQASVQGQGAPSAAATPEKDSSGAFTGVLTVEVQNLAVGQSVLTVTADKKTNFGTPSVENTTMMGRLPNVAFVTAPPDKTGHAKLVFELHGDSALTYHVWTTNGSAAYGTAVCNANADGTFDVKNDPNWPLWKGDNTLHVDVKNAFGSAPFADTHTQGVSPQFSNLVSTGTSDGQSVAVAQGATQEQWDMQFTLTGTLEYSDGFSWQYVNGSGTTVRGAVNSGGAFSLPLNVGDEGQFPVSLTASNDFDTITYDFTILKPEWLWTWDFTLTYGIANSSVYRMDLDALDPGAQQSRSIANKVSGETYRFVQQFRKNDNYNATPQFYSTFYEMSMNNGSVHYTQTDQCVGQFSIDGMLSLTQGNNPHNPIKLWPIILSLPQPYVLDVVDTTYCQDPQNGTVFFRTADVTYGWGLGSQQAYYQEGLELK